MSGPRGRFGGGRGGGGRGGGGRGGGRYGSNADFSYDPEEERFRKLFIGGLSYDTTDKTLKEHYEKWGEVVDVVVMKDPHSKRSRGFGFVTYSQSTQVDDAQENRPHTIDGREVECKRAMPRDGNESQELIKKLFCGGLQGEVQEDVLQDYFSGFGNVLKVDVIRDKETQKCKGFAFVEFDDYDPVDKCVLKKRHDVGGKTIDVSKALPKDKDGGGGRRGGKMGGGGYGQQSGGYGGGGYGQSSWNQGGGYGGGDDYGYGSMGSGYNDSYGGGPMRGGGGYSQRGPGPYGGGYGSGGYSQGGGGQW